MRPLCHDPGMVRDGAEAAGGRLRARLQDARLYFITEATATGRDVVELVSAALEGGVDMVQLRDKDADAETITEIGARLRTLCDEHDALLIVNDRPDLALACGADGVHLGQADLPPDRARRLMGPQLLIGLSTHSPEQVTRAQDSAADYLGVGPVHATPTKPTAAPVGEPLLRHAAAHATKPFFAIGGIDQANVGDAVAAGARRVAVVRAIRDAADPRAVAEALRARLDAEAHAGAAR